MYCPQCATQNSGEARFYRPPNLMAGAAYVLRTRPGGRIQMRIRKG